MSENSVFQCWAPSRSPMTPCPPGRESTFLITWTHHLGENLLCSQTLWFTCQLFTTELSVPFQRTEVCWQLERFSTGRKDEVQFTTNVLKQTLPGPYALVGRSFLGVIGLLVCHRWLWMVIASTLADNVLAGMWLNCFLSELYL